MFVKDDAAAEARVSAPRAAPAVQAFLQVSSSCARVCREWMRRMPREVER